MRDRLGTYIKATLLGGIAILLPLTGVAFLMKYAFGFAQRLSAPILNQLPQMEFGRVALATIVTIIIMLVACFVAGLLTNVQRATKLSTWLEENILYLIPGYLMIRSLAYNMTGKEDSKNTKVVLARIEDSWQLGFLMETLDNGTLVVFVPASPTPFSGSVYYMDADRVRSADIDMKSAMQIVRRFGVGSNKALKDPNHQPFHS